MPPRGSGRTFNMEYNKALEHAAMLADQTGQSGFIIGLGDDYAVLSYKPKPLAGRNIQEVLPRARSDPPTWCTAAGISKGMAAPNLGD